MMRRPVDHQPICWAVAAAQVAIGMIAGAPARGTSPPTRATCMPPIEPPMTVTPAPHAEVVGEGGLACARRRGPTRPGSGSPTACRRRGAGGRGRSCPGSRRGRWRTRRSSSSVSSALPGPMRASHHPAVGWPSMSGPAAWLSPVRAWQTSTALLAVVGQRDPRSRRRCRRRRGARRRLRAGRAGSRGGAGTGAGRGGRRAARRR